MIRNNGTKSDQVEITLSYFIENFKI